MCQRISSGYYAECAMIVCMAVAPYDKSQKDWQANAGSYDRCPDCGGWKAKKAYRCRACSPKPAEAARARWKDNPSDSAGRTRAQNLHALPENCERCARAVRLERHHLDANPANNERGNIQFLCRRCHMEVDGRLDKLRVMSPEPRAARRCSECGLYYKPLRGGLCHACDERRRRRERHDDIHAGRSGRYDL
jgi:hypothetical protein